MPRRGLKRSGELPIDDPRSEVRGRGLHVPIVTPTVQQTERPADAADANMSMGKMELISNEAAKMKRSAKEVAGVPRTGAKQSTLGSARGQ